MYIKQRKICECTDGKIEPQHEEIHIYSPTDSAVEELQVS